MIAAYRNPERSAGQAAMAAVIDTLRESVPAPLDELRHLDRTPNQQAADVLAYFERPGTSNRPTEASNRHPEHLQGSPWTPAT